jgi:hypothetical protein
MIKTETREINGRMFDYTYSDAGYMIERDGVEYSEAYDPAGSGRTYTETDHEIEPADEYLAELIEEVKADE